MEFFNPVQFNISSGSRKKIIDESLGKSVLVFCSKTAFNRLTKDKLLSALFNQTNIIFDHSFGNNPSLEDIKSISRMYQTYSFDLIIGIGGGSTMDVAKVACISIPAYKIGISIEELLINTNINPGLKAIVCIQVPTTAGTGSELTHFATIWDYEKKQKKSLNHPSMFAKKAYIDPDFLSEIPIDIAIATALDALNQAFESIWNLNANLFTRSMARHAIVLGLECLPIINDINDDPSLRTKLCIASVSAGMAISQTRTSICHSISYPLTLKYGIDHGLACAFSMIAVYKFNLLSIASDINIIRNYIKEDPLIVIESIFKKHDLYARLAKSLPSKAKFSSEIEEFITTGRFENNIRKCSREDLVEILNTSYDCVMN